MAASDLESVRAELRRLGYLSHGVERFLLQDALRPRPPWRALLTLAAKVAGLAGAPVAVAAAFALAGANGALTASPLDVLALFAHLCLPIAAAVGAAFLGLCAVLGLALRLWPARGVETLALLLALAAVGGAAALAFWRGRFLLASLPGWALAAATVGGPLLAYALVRVLYDGLLALAIRLTALPPRGARLSRRSTALALAAAVVLVALPLALAARPPAPPVAAILPAAPGGRVLLLGIDGVLPEEFDYLLARGDLPGIEALLAAGGWVASYQREEVAPATFWTTVATGRAASGHGMAALDSFRPLGVETPLLRSGPLRLYWQRAALPLGLAEYRPVLANRRAAWALWELAARGGLPVAAVNWWATFPAEPLPGLVLAHGAYQLLAESAPGALAPESARSRIEELRRAAAGPAGPRDPLAAALPPDAAAAVLERALIPDRFYRQALARELAGAPRAAALYLPGLDLAADGWRGGDVALADLVRQELAAADSLLAGVAAELGALAVVLDPGRRVDLSGRALAGRALAGRALAGRILFWRRGGCAAPAAGVEPRAVAAALLRELGLPQSAELLEPPGDCPWPEPPARLAAYPPRPATGPGPAPVSEEYLRNLRALGYL
jgi:hypothetical protein